MDRIKQFTEELSQAWSKVSEKVYQQTQEASSENPADSEGNIPQDFIESAAEGHDFDLDGVSDEFRYLKFSITSNYGSDTYVHGSEITLWGLDNIQ